MSYSGSVLAAAIVEAYLIRLTRSCTEASDQLTLVRFPADSHAEQLSEQSLPSNSLQFSGYPRF